MLKLSILRWREYLSGPNIITTFVKGGRKESQSKGEVRRCCSAIFENERRGHELRDAGGLQKAEKTRT